MKGHPHRVPLFALTSEVNDDRLPLRTSRMLRSLQQPHERSTTRHTRRSRRPGRTTRTTTTRPQHRQGVRLVMRVCSTPECHEIIPVPGKCPAHKRATEYARGTRQQRGYDANHDQLRAQWEPRVATGRVRCARCHRPIQPATPWDLGHHDTDRTRYTGPEHATCNRSAGGRAAHA